ncbi:Rrf2 family transcriptional regulator [Weissella ceti]|uniref:Rrf2 family transcriptional regulator n=1 Tax=Weissella ceti TaxID=759620 RepID=A0ABT3E4W8_9LACO|nr:Rrf2 family transcriptional regulator [Weissella ceti]MCW0953465.1 Rrf2 family transcriptional regulator [Weissella ceti]QVK12066.1 Rrf2 family transcriptional regulator [Weissella ceti]
MQLKQSFEEAICIVLLLAAERAQERRINSAEIVAKLGTSQSYVKKILGQLVHADIISSGAGKHGGFFINKALEELTLLDVYYAIEGRDTMYQPKHIADRFLSDKHFIREKEDDIIQIFSDAEKAYREKLSTYKLSNLQDIDVFKKARQA